jgi:dihydroorotate dehydrogenase electron transfer subunit
MMKHFIAQIISNVPVSDCFYELTFKWDASCGVPLPGQFCTIRVSPYTAPLLRRPLAFSAYDVKTSAASIIYKKRGPATELLAGKVKGAGLDVIGPLGNDFIRMLPGGVARVFLVAGGTGFGPILYLGTTLKKMNRHIAMVLGCRTKSQLPRMKAFSSVKAVICTDDGSEGIKGTPIEYLLGLTPEQFKGAVVFSCGPSPLLARCHDWAKKHGLACYVSLEQVMACGVGACMGCAVKVADAQGNGYVRACTEGPVFESERIVWT